MNANKLKVNAIIVLRELFCQVFTVMGINEEMVTHIEPSPNLKIVVIRFKAQLQLVICNRSNTL